MTEIVLRASASLAAATALYGIILWRCKTCTGVGLDGQDLARRLDDEQRRLAVELSDETPRRHLRAAGAGHSGYRTLASDSENILNEAVYNFYAIRRVRALADKWAATKLSSGEPSIVTQAFAIEILAALADPRENP